VVVGRRSQSRIRGSYLKEVDIEKKVVEILGHKAWIEGVKGCPADPPWWPEDRICVWLDFEKPAGSTLGFGVNIPVRSYTRDEFLAAVRMEGEHRLMVILEGYRTKREPRELKQQELNQKVEEIKALIGLDTTGVSDL